VKKAFTLLELVFVIIVIGILAAAIITSTRSNPLQEAATQLLSHIRYTQHLSMVNDKFDANDANWYKKRWQIIFGSSNVASDLDTDGKIAYSIFADDSALNGNPNLSEIAKDSMNSDQYLSGGYSGTLSTKDSRANKKMNLGLSYNIDDVQLSGGCTGANTKRILFDHLGRPIEDSVKTYVSSYKSGKLLENACIITLISTNEGNISIYVEPETGYAHIL